MRVLYFDCPAGLSGDMTLGALLDLGLDAGILRAELEKLGIHSEYELEISKGCKCGVAGTAVRVNVIHGHHGDAASGHGHRRLADIEGMISDSTFDSHVKETAISMFRALAEAEGRVHGVPPEDVHFHEVGAVDSIVDIVGVCICMEMLKADSVVFSPLNTGSGRVKCQHGILPVPAPATAELLKGVPSYSDGTPSELTTPTGALIARCFAQAFGPQPEMAVERIGYGLGMKEFEFPNAVRILLGHEVKEEAQTISVVECNVDDMTGEALGYALEKLFAFGALDAFFTPIFMKKNRPAYMLTALCRKAQQAEIESVLLSETTTLGVRVSETRRTTLLRRVETVDTPWGSVRVKAAEGPRGVKFAPEYEDCRGVAQATGQPYLNVYASAMSLAKQKFSRSEE